MVDDQIGRLGHPTQDQRRAGHAELEAAEVFTLHHQSGLLGLANAARVAAWADR